MSSVIKQTDVKLINPTPANVCCLILVTKNINFTICRVDKKYTLCCPRDEFVPVEGGLENALNMQMWAGCGQ